MTYYSCICHACCEGDRTINSAARIRQNVHSFHSNRNGSKSQSKTHLEPHPTTAHTNKFFVILKHLKLPEKVL